MLLSVCYKNTVSSWKQRANNYKAHLQRKSLQQMALPVQLLRIIALTQLHRQLTPYPTEVTIFHIPGVEHHTSLTYVTAFSRINKHTTCQLNLPISSTSLTRRHPVVSAGFSVLSTHQVFSSHQVVSSSIYNHLWLVGYKTQSTRP